MPEEAVVTLADGSIVRYREVENFPSYRVGSDGSLWSCWVHARYRHLGAGWHRLQGWTRRWGHIMIRLREKDGSKREVFIHRLVLEAFVGPCPEGMECRHLNGNPADNRLENLCWGTSTENKADTARHGNTARGERNGSTKLSVAEVLEIRSRYAAGGINQYALAKEFCVSQRCIHGIVTRKHWRHL